MGPHLLFCFSLLCFVLTGHGYDRHDRSSSGGFSFLFGSSLPFGGGRNYLFLFYLFFAEAQPPRLQVRGTPARREVIHHARGDRWAWAGNPPDTPLFYT